MYVNVVWFTITYECIISFFRYRYNISHNLSLSFLS